MLKGINPILSGDLLKALSDMGHGDAIAICDGNFPSHSHATRQPPLQVAETDTVEVVKAILTVLPLDEGSNAFGHIGPMMAETHDKHSLASIRDSFTVAVVAATNPKSVGFNIIPRLEFYHQARSAYAVVATTDPRHYACFMLRKGVLPANAWSAATNWSEVSVSKLGLRGGQSYSLRRGKIRTIADLLEKDEQDLLALPDFGQVSLDKLKQALAERGLKLRQ